MNETLPSFSLRKWYMDCIDKSGNLFLGYSSTLKWKRIEINYASKLTCTNGSKIATATSLRNQSHPTLVNGTLVWHNDQLKINGRWTSVDPMVRENILYETSGSLVWTCNQPKSLVKLTSDDMTFDGAIGYTEMVEMTILPWLLPIANLRWGRFLSRKTTLIWIIWEGELDFHIVYYNGNRIDGVTVTDTEVILNKQEMTLAFSDTVILRSGSLASTIFSHVPVLYKMIPAGFLKSQERKWRSRGELIKNKVVIDRGWAIHEMVTWEK